MYVCVCEREVNIWRSNVVRVLWMPARACVGCKPKQTVFDPLGRGGSSCFTPSPERAFLSPRWLCLSFLHEPRLTRSNITGLELLSEDNMHAIRSLFNRHLHCTLAKELNMATERDYYLSLAHTVRDHVMAGWFETQRAYYRADPKVCVCVCVCVCVFGCACRGDGAGRMFQRPPFSSLCSALFLFLPTDGPVSASTICRWSSTWAAR
jgi:hypothetical protein